MKYRETPYPRLFAHRGASAAFPENTMEAFTAGMRAGAEMLELDVHASRDGEIVVFHDDTLERTTDGSGLVREHTLAELRKLDAGFHSRDLEGSPHRAKGVRIPTLSELLEELPGVPLNIEIKQESPAIESTVVQLLEKYGALESVLLAAADDGLLTRIRALVGSEAHTGFATMEATDFVLRSQRGDFDGYTAPGFALQVPPEHAGIRVATPELIDAARGLGVEVHFWTINVPGEIETLVELGADGIMSDDPAMAASVLKRYRRS